MADSTTSRLGLLRLGAGRLGFIPTAGGSSVSESITLAVISAQVALSPAGNQRPTITLAVVSAEIAFAQQLAAVNPVALATSENLTPDSTVTAVNPLSFDLAADLALATNADMTVPVSIDAELDWAIVRFVDGEISIAAALGLVASDGIEGATPGTFRPDGPSGPAGIFRAIDAGDATPGTFRPASDIGTPGRFKPTG